LIEQTSGDRNDEARRRRAELLQAVTSEYGGLLSLRSQVGTEVSFRATLYFASLTGSVVTLGFVAQRGQFLTLFTLILLPVIFFLGLFTFGRMAQNGVQFVIASHSIERIRRFYREIDPAHQELFPEIHPTDFGLMTIGLFNIRWQVFLATTTTVAIVDAAVAGTAVATLLGSIWALPIWLLATFGVVVAVGVSAAFLRYQSKVWRRLGTAVPGLLPERGRDISAKSPSSQKIRARESH
jgi:hypothetical protein